MQIIIRVVFASEVVQAAKDTLNSHGFGMSVRFFYLRYYKGIHKTLEKFRVLWFRNAVYTPSAFKWRRFEPLLSDKDVLISDSLSFALTVFVVQQHDYRYENSYGRFKIYKKNYKRSSF
jgi:glycine C-acetyltransferase